MGSVDAEPDVASEPSGTGPAEPASPGPGRSRTPLIFLTAALVVALDQATKSWAVNALADGHVVHLVGSLQLSLHKNSGASFSMGSNLGPIIGVLAIVVVAVLAVTGRSTRSTLTAVVVGLLIGGALGNLTDRAFRAALPGSSGFLHGAVVDFIDLQWWPVFNVADSAISVGAVLMIIASLRPDPKGGTSRSRATRRGPSSAGSS